MAASLSPANVLKTWPAFIEVFPNIRSLTIHFTLPPAPATTHVSRSLVSIVSVASKQPLFVIPLPLPVDPATVRRVPAKPTPSSLLSLTLAFAPSASVPSAASIPSPPLAHLRGVFCHICQTSLALSPAVFAPRVVPAPSDYWHELTDCWACHTEDYTRMDGQVGGVVLAQKGKAIVADGTVLLHPADLEMAGIVVERESGAEVSFSYAPGRVVRGGGEAAGSFRKTKKASTSAQVFLFVDTFFQYQCVWAPSSAPHPRERHIFVKSYLRESTALENILVGCSSRSPDMILAMKIYRYCVDFEVGDGVDSTGPSRMIHTRLVSHFADDLLESANAHATYRFAVFSPGSNTPKLLANVPLLTSISKPTTLFAQIWLLNWHLHLSLPDTPETRELAKLVPHTDVAVARGTVNPNEETIPGMRPGETIPSCPGRRTLVGILLDDRESVSNGGKDVLMFLPR
ncbi:hypothetical protein BDK51DRAFT_49633 [Blyttiomyces helicus]|uniref:Ubiquitin-conjugating enzyme E2-binding protein n=1 Tax=Blyttiomyces helicus TaxID=388810 RepID=A0A4P9WMD9_9FUNG|nr:hypothetical protein BDK51DRAFT_49633 [Blyttiomyces helicus]|eukprot:RKO93642.1 hypothetical protein BDK51DRAFT_49633 [Blyttiomyces helicus]